MKLAQNQVWRTPGGFLRIVQLDRVEVHYKEMPDLRSGLGKHHQLSKKEFCRLLKDGELLTSEQVRAIYDA